jgi:hypothetical protein
MTDETSYPAYDFGTCVDRLPPRARRKYNALLAIVEDSEALLRVCNERDADVSTRAGVLRAAHDSRNSLLAENAGTLRRLQKQLDELAAEHRTIDERRAKLSSARANAQQVLAHLRHFITQHFGERVLTAWEAPEVTPTLNEDEAVSDAIIRIRREVRVLQGQLARVKNASLPASEVKAWLHQQVQAWASDGPRILVIDGKPEIIAPDLVRFVAPGQPLATPAGAVLRYEAALRPAELIARLEATIEDSPDAIPSAEKPARVALLEEQIIGLEHSEEALCEVAIGEGLACHRRPDMSGFALLGLQSAEQAARQLQAAE